MSKKFIFVNSDGLNEESPGAYETSDFINESAGATDAGKPIVLDADGNIDATMINDADIDHGSIGGLGDDDHTHYTLADGTRDFSGVVSYDAHPTFNDDLQIVDKKYVDDSIAFNGVRYTVGTGGVSAGDVVYISADDTVLPFSDISDPYRAIGLAFTTELAAAEVGVAANDTVVEGILTSAVAGTPYYWDGTDLTDTIPATSGAHVWQAGVAKNETDLHVEVRYVKKNS